MAVDDASGVTETTERVNIDIAVCSASDRNQRDPRFRNACIPYGQRISRVGHCPCCHSICWCNTRQ